MRAMPAAPASSKRGPVTGWSRDPAHRQLVGPPWVGPIHPVALLGCALGLWCRVSCSTGIWGLFSSGRGCLALKQVERCLGSEEGTGMWGLCLFHRFHEEMMEKD